VERIQIRDKHPGYATLLFCDVYLLFRKVFELFNDNCSRALQCGPEICVDETLYANRGRGFDFRQFLPLKPSRYGFLFKSLGDSINAYIYRSDIYAGRPAKEPTDYYIQGKKLPIHLILLIAPHHTWIPDPDLYPVAYPGGMHRIPHPPPHPVKSWVRPCLYPYPAKICDWKIMSICLPDLQMFLTDPQIRKSN